MTDVRIETVAAPVLFVPGPNASKAACTLDRIRDLATEGRRFLRYADDDAINPIALDVIEEALHTATRPMRHGLSDHNNRMRAELHAQQFTADTGAKESTDEPSPEPTP